MPRNLLALKHTHTHTHANREQKEPSTGLIQFSRQIWCQRLRPRLFWAGYSRDLSPAKWILHSAEMWYLNFLIGVGNREMLGDPCWFRKLAARLQSVRAVIRMAAARPLLTGVTYIRTGASLWRPTIIKQKLYRATVIFSRAFKRFFLRPNWSPRQGKDGRLKPVVVLTQKNSSYWRLSACSNRPFNFQQRSRRTSN